ncbi:MAG: hypothetical protein LKJ03_09090 [Enterococcaceae bacterium]|jgi:hypothetical protein|nr:hypothetical protein [Enterococcaceae bacterium]
MKLGRYYHSPQIELFENTDNEVYVKKGGMYFFSDSSLFQKELNSSDAREISCGPTDYIAIVLVLGSFLLIISEITFSYYLIFNDKISTGKNDASTLFLSMGFLCINIFLHEIAHASWLRIWQRKPGNIKIRRKFIFPMIVVDTSDSYLLPRNRRLAVYAGGVMMNSWTIFLLWMIAPQYFDIVFPTISMVLYCLIPFGGIRNDGFHILFSVILKRESIKNQRSWVDIVGLVMFSVLMLYPLLVSLFR